MSSTDRTIRSHQHQNVATILAIGTATPPNCINQTDYPDFFFRATKSNHLINLKEKFTRMCEKSTIKKRYMYVTEDLLKEYPAISTYKEPSLDIRQSILMKEVPKLGMEAAVKAVKEWNQPTSSLTHLIFVTSSGTTMPSADHELVKLMGLSPSIKRFMMYQQGCFAGAAALRLAKDIAENNPRSRVLIVCSENTLCCFRAPHEDHLDVLVGSAIFADGAAAVVVGAGPGVSERPMFEVLSAKQHIVPDSEDGIVAHVLEMGYAYYLSKKLPGYVGNNIVECFLESVGPFGVTDRDSLFYVVHPGGPRVLDVVEDKLGLGKDKLKMSRRVLNEYGNIWSASVFFVLDEMRKRSVEDGKVTTGEGNELGVLFALGPGVTVETIVLRSVSIHVSV